MATAKNMNKNVCDQTFMELDDVKNRLVELRDNIVHTDEADGKIRGLYERHLCELIDQIDWKLQIMAHACSYDWKGSDMDEYVDNTASVGPVEIPSTEFSPGYVGG